MLFEEAHQDIYKVRDDTAEGQWERRTEEHNEKVRYAVPVVYPEVEEEHDTGKLKKILGILHFFIRFPQRFHIKIDVHFII